MSLAVYPFFISDISVFFGYGIRLMEKGIMYITIDGLSGAGKSVQADRVSKALGWKSVSIDDMKSFGEHIWQMNFGGPGYDQLSKLLYDLALIRAHIDYATEDFVFCDNFYRLLWTFYLKNLGIDEALSVFQQAVPRPIASIYLNVDARERHMRKFYVGNENLYRIENIDFLTEMNHDEEDFCEFFQWLSKRIPHIHILDGTKSVEAVTDEIVRIVHANTVFSG